MMDKTGEQKEDEKPIEISWKYTIRM